MSKYSYAVGADGTATFDVTPSGRPLLAFWFGTSIVTAVAVLAFIVAMEGMAMGDGGAFIGGAVVAAIFGCWAIFQLFLAGSARHRKRRRFTVSSSEVTFGAERVATDRVNDIEIRNSAVRRYQESGGGLGVAYVGSGVAGIGGVAYAGVQSALASGGQAVRAAASRAVANYCYFIVLEYNGRESVLAGGLTSPTARGLVADIVRASRGELR